MLEPGLWLVWVTLDEIEGMTIFAVDDDCVAVPLGGDRSVYLFPTRCGVAAFLESGQAHNLSDRVAGFDPRTAVVEDVADFPDFRDKLTYDDEWWTCQVLVDACGIDNTGLTLDDMIKQVTARTWLRTDFERPGFDDFDYWLDRVITPCRLVLPSGTGITLADDMAVVGLEPNDGILGAPGEVLVFRDEADLMAYLADGLPATLRGNETWARDLPEPPPHCQPYVTIDLAALPDMTATDEDTWGDALGFLRSMVTVLSPGSTVPFERPPLERVWDVDLPGDLKPRHRAAAAAALRHWVDYVDQHITWR